MKKEWTQLWLEYSAKVDNGNKNLVKTVNIDGFNKEHRIIKSGITELQKGIFGMLAADVKVSDVNISGISIKKDAGIKAEGYSLTGSNAGVILKASDEKGILYGVFHILRTIATENPLRDLNIICEPDNPLRMFNHWDNMDNSIERGYSGESFFFENGEIIISERIRDYARLVASIGINGVVINNVNVKDCATWLITNRYFEKVAQLSEIFADYGIRLFLSLNYAAPMELSGLSNADPFDKEVIGWWKEKIAEVYANIPNFGGFLVKADSEGRPGPFTYGRTQADGANMLADIVKKYNAIIIWRCFVYNCTQDWRDTKTDRARAGTV